MVSEGKPCIPIDKPLSRRCRKTASAVALVYATECVAGPSVVGDAVGNSVVDLSATVSATALVSMLECVAEPSLFPLQNEDPALRLVYLSGKGRQQFKRPALQMKLWRRCRQWRRGGVGNGVGDGVGVSVLQSALLALMPVLPL